MKEKGKKLTVGNASTIEYMSRGCLRVRERVRGEDRGLDLWDRLNEGFARLLVTCIDPLSLSLSSLSNGMDKKSGYLY